MLSFHRQNSAWLGACLRLISSSPDPCVSISSPCAPCYLFKLSTTEPQQEPAAEFPIEAYLQRGSTLIQMKLFVPKAPFNSSSWKEPVEVLDQNVPWTDSYLWADPSCRDYISYNAIRSPWRSWKSRGRGCLGYRALPAKQATKPWISSKNWMDATAGA